MTDNEILMQILDNIKEMKTDISELKTKVSNLEQGQKNLDAKVSNLEQGQKNLDAKVSNLEQGQKEIKDIVKHNYDITLEFYANQKEHNTEVSDMLYTIAGEVDMHNNQIARNTAVIRRIK